MLRLGGWYLSLAVAVSAVTAPTGAAHAQALNQSLAPKPTGLPNPYRLVEGWPSLPQSMNGGHWGEVRPDASPSRQSPTRLEHSFSPYS
jgi:hypothetical protein